MEDFTLGHDSPSVSELRSSLPPLPSGLERATYANVTGNISFFHSSSSVQSPGRPKCVIQAASQFNVLEMVGPLVTPDQGITGYFRDRTQGPACALSCPAGTGADITSLARTLQN